MSDSPEFQPTQRFQLLLGYLLREDDELDHVLEIDAFVSTFAAKRYRHIDAMRQAALADPKRTSHTTAEVIERSVRFELAAALRITENRAAALLAHADGLVNRYPSVLDSLSRHRVTETHATALAEALDAVEPESRDELLPQALALAEKESVGKFRRRLRMLIDRVRVVTLEQRHREALERRRVFVQHDENGMAWTMIYGPAVEAQAISNRITTMAKRIKEHPDESRTLDQIRADVTGDLLIEGWTDAVAPEVRGIRATVAVTVPVLALLEDSPVEDSPVEACAGW